METRLNTLLGLVPTAEAMRLLALEFDEVDDRLTLIATLASVAAVGVVMLSHDQGVQPHDVLAQIRQLMANGGIE